MGHSACRVYGDQQGASFSSGARSSGARPGQGADPRRRTGASPTTARPAPPPAGAGRRGRLERIFERDPDLLRHVSEETARAARRETVVALRRIPRGAWFPSLGERGGEADLGLLVLDGLLTRRMALGDRHSVELLGRGDLLRPWQPDCDQYAIVPSRAQWKVLIETEVAVLDEQFEADVVGLRGVLAELLGRAVLRSRALALRLAIGQHAKLTVRLTLLFWHLADRWGVRESDAIVLPLPLSHETIAELVSAQRPSVSVALAQLSGEGVLSRRPGGHWAIHGDVPTELRLRA